MKKPDEIPVVHLEPDCEDYLYRDDYPTGTALFRECGIFDATVMAVTDKQAHEPEAQFNALSVGCSIGTEVDAIASILRGHDEPDGHLVGLDPNRIALHLATLATYGVEYNLEQGKDSLLQSLESYGFDITGIDVKLPNHNVGYFGVAARTLRRDHHISFYEGALLPEYALQEGGSHLVACNNVLPYILKEEGEDFFTRHIDGLARQVRPGGILNIGCHPGFFTKSRTAAWGMESYADMHLRASERLTSLYGLQTVLAHKDTFSVALRRPQ